ncbi:MAG: NnrS family protein [Rubrivivax sp.]|nr:NnrS family protein [Rubrivivax sp.]
MTTAAAARWRAARLLASPHRLGFLAAATVMAGSALGWLLVLQAGGSLVAGTALPAGAAHALVFVFGFMPLFFAGFVFTVGPRWLGLAVRDADAAARTRALLAPVLLYATAWLAWWPLPAWLPEAAAAHAPAALLALAAAAWTAIVRQMHRLLRASPPRDSPHLRLVVRACDLGAAALWVAALAVAGGSVPCVVASAQAGLWLFCGGVFATASHRMLPLDAMAAQPALERRFPLWQLLLVGGTLALQALDVVVAAAWSASAPAAVSALLAAVTAATALWLALIAWRWARRQRLGRQLVAMLHAGLVWLAAAFGLQAAAHACAATGDAGLSHALGQAALHALALGWMGSTMLAMVSRVAGAFGGQARAADGIAWALFALVQVAALARVAAALGPAATGLLTTIAGTAWTAAAVGWLLVYGRWLGRAPERPPHLGT